MTRTQLAVAVGTAFLSFVGALLGVYVSSRLDQGNWETRFLFEQRKTVLERRVALMERTVVLFNKATLVAGLRDAAKFEQASTSLNVACAKLAMKPGPVPASCKQATTLDSSRMEAIAKELTAMNADFSATMALASIYFGPETKSAIAALGGDPWAAGSAAYQRLLDSMGREMRQLPE